MEERQLIQWEEGLGKIIKGEAITKGEAKEIFSLIMRGEVDEALQFCLFSALSVREPFISVEEWAGFGAGLRESFGYDFSVNINEPIIHIGGTGGGISTINVSTTSFFVGAGAGAIMGKSGARAVASKAGSVDVAVCLGINIHPTPEVAKKCLEEIGLSYISVEHKWFDTFLFKLRQRKDASALFKCIMPGLRVILVAAVLAPLKASRFVRGLSSPQTELIAKFHVEAGHTRSFVFCGKGPKEGDYLDEISNIGETIVTEVKDGELINYTLTPADCGLPLSTPEDIRGGNSPQDQTGCLINILKGKDKGPRRDIVLMNSAAIIYLADKARDLIEGVEMARESLESGKALEKLVNLVHYGGGNIERLNSWLKG